MEPITTYYVYVCSAIFTTDNQGAMKYENRPEALRFDIIHLNSFVTSSWWCPNHTVEGLVWKLSETFSSYINMEPFISAQSGPAKTFSNCKAASLLIKQFVERILA